MDHEPILENQSSAAVYMLPNNTIYLKAIKYLNIRLRHIRVQKIQDRMLNLELLCWKNALVVVVLIFLNHDGLCEQVISNRL